MSATPRPLSFVEKFGYGLGDTATNFVFQTMMYFQLSFYTDTYGLTATQAGTLFLVVRIFDAFVDPAVGMLADRTNTRWGKFRPWILATSIPLCVLAVLTFTTPDLTGGAKLLYAYVTYTLLMVMFSASNIPYSALSGVMTDDEGQRASLSTYRFILAFLGGVVIQVFALPMVNHFGGGNMQKGYQTTMLLLCSVAVVMFFITFFTTRERITPISEAKTSIRGDLRDLVKNKPWVNLFFVSLMLFIAMAIRGGANVYYYKYYFQREDLLSWANAFGIAGTLIGIFFSKPLATRFGKKGIFQFALLSSVVLCVAQFLVPTDKPQIAVALGGLMALLFGPSIPILWVMLADVADYGEWKFKRRATGIIFSAISFGFKAGLGVGGFIAGKILDLHGYVPNAVQSESSLLGIRLSVTLYGVAPYAVASVILISYSINTEISRQITADLRMRRDLANKPATEAGAA
ncbi:MAG: MFS transporter [Opitutaceae bacterium]|nr:MFS transporter [Opitutaceae bacterium]